MLKTKINNDYYHFKLSNKARENNLNHEKQDRMNKDVTDSTPNICSSITVFKPRNDAKSTHIICYINFLLLQSKPVVAHGLYASRSRSCTENNKQVRYTNLDLYFSKPKFNIYLTTGYKMLEINDDSPFSRLTCRIILIYPSSPHRTPAEFWPNQ